MTLTLATISATHILIAIAIAIIVFGAPKLPGIARSMGESMRIFKSETRKMKEEDEAAKNSDSTTSSKTPIEGSIVDDEEEFSTQATEKNIN
ncbi:MAG: Sec-independent protein translocase subunit TatA [Micrococcaceae bacterium]